MSDEVNLADREEVKEWLAEAIDESLDIDWQSSWGAEHILGAMEIQGITFTRETATLQAELDAAKAENERLRAEREEYFKATKWAIDNYANQNMGHEDFRVTAFLKASEAWGYDQAQGEQP